MPTVTLLPGDCLQSLRALADCSVDACVTDPPAGIAFMGRDWDHDKGGRTAWVAWMTAVMTEVHRVLKPGGHAFVWALPRTAHWTATALEDAGFEIRDKVYHLFGSGFPKSLAVDKALDKAAGAERAVVGKYTHPATGKVHADFRTDNDRYVYGGFSGCEDTRNITAPATDLAAQWAGWGTALKPAAEEWILARKPLAGTVAATVAAWGTGALNIAASRVGYQGVQDAAQSARPGHTGETSPVHVFGPTHMHAEQNPAGRWPPNVLLQHSTLCNGVCHESCPVAALDAQSGVGTSQVRKGYQNNGSAWGGGGANPMNTYGDTGGASRFYPVFTPDPPAPMFYCAKASRRERNAGCAGLPEQAAGGLDGRHDGSLGSITMSRNTHPTVKPQALMRWLCTLITPPGGTVLDPFMGSGSTGVAAVTLGYHFIGCEQDASYMAIAEARMAYAQEQQPAATQPALEMTA